MAIRKIIVKTSRSRQGTVSRAAIRKAVHKVFGTSTVVQPVQVTSAKGRRTKKAKAGVLQAQ